MRAVTMSAIRSVVTIGGRARPGLRRLLKLWLLAAFAVPTVVGAAAPVWADGATPSIQLAARPHGHAVRLVATVEVPVAGSPTSAGAPVAGATVSFSIRLGEFAGAPLLSLGSATTNADGTATFSYTPTWTGRQTIVATAADTTGATIASATRSFSAAWAAHPFAGAVQAVRPDGAIGSVVAAVLLATLAVLWITLIAIVVRVHLGLTARRA